MSFRIDSNYAISHNQAMNIQDMLTTIKAKGYSDREIGERAGIDQSIVSRLRNGKHKSTNFAAGKAIEQFYQEVLTQQDQAA